MKQFNGVKVFSATMQKMRDELGDKVTDWIRSHPEYELVDVIVKQSSDEQFHCISMTVFYWDTTVAKPAVLANGNGNGRKRTEVRP